LRSEFSVAISFIDAANTSRERAAVNLQLVSDLADITVPLSAIGLANFDDGVVGLAGTLSSLIGVYTQWKKTA
jgi:peroxin-11B